MSTPASPSTGPELYRLSACNYDGPDTVSASALPLPTAQELVRHDTDYYHDRIEADEAGSLLAQLLPHVAVEAHGLLDRFLTALRAEMVHVAGDVFDSRHAAEHRED